MNINNIVDDIKSNQTCDVVAVCSFLKQEYELLSSSEALIICTLADTLKADTTVKHNPKAIASATEQAVGIMEKAIENSKPKDLEVKHHWRRVVSAEMLKHFISYEPRDAAQKAVNYADALLELIEEIEDIEKP